MAKGGERIWSTNGLKYLEDMMKEYNVNQEGAAKMLGLSSAAIYNYIKAEKVTLLTEYACRYYLERKVKRPENKNKQTFLITISDGEPRIKKTRDFQDAIMKSLIELDIESEK